MRFYISQMTEKQKLVIIWFVQSLWQEDENEIVIINNIIIIFMEINMSSKESWNGRSCRIWKSVGIVEGEV